MPNYLATLPGTLVVAMLAVSAACADDQSPAAHAPAAKPAAMAQSGAQAAARPAAPAAQPAATPSTPASGARHYVQAPAGSSLGFTFMQAGAENHGTFKKFSTQLDYDEKNLAGSSLRVTVEIASLDTQDQDRDTTLASAELFDTQKHPTATYVAKSLGKRANGGLEAIGTLTLRGVAKDLRVPLTLKPTAKGLELTGEVGIRRLDFGVGQGEWQSTEWVGDDVKLAYKVALAQTAPK